ncbi:FkbM family methyltransferase [Candidatus Dependentiae bacterium]|nr:FkbM family methyltransferase [Candidatus Dependentiae bacterium]
MKILILSLVFLSLIHNQENLYCSDSLSYDLVGGLSNILVCPISESIGHTWSNGSVYDKHLIEKFYELLKKHDDYFVALDLGAQTGCFSLLAKFFPNSKWYAFEPIEEAAGALKKNLALNDISNVFVYQMAAADFKGKAILKMPAMNAWGLACIGSNIERFTVVMEREIECVDLDSFVLAENIEKVHFIKIDTEGAEFAILNGAKKMIMRDHPIIIMEYNEANMRQCGSSKEKINNLLSAFGYEWKLVSSDDILCMPKKGKARFFSYIF